MPEHRDGGISVSERELAECVLLTRQNNEDIALLMKKLNGNGVPGLVQRVCDIELKVQILVGAMLLLAAPLIGGVLAFAGGLLINRVEVIIH
jgi:hypothetical protein